MKYHIGDTVLLKAKIDKIEKYSETDTVPIHINVKGDDNGFWIPQRCIIALVKRAKVTKTLYPCLDDLTAEEREKFERNLIDNPSFEVTKTGYRIPDNPTNPWRPASELPDNWHSYKVLQPDGVHPGGYYDKDDKVWRWGSGREEIFDGHAIIPDVIAWREMEK